MTERRYFNIIGTGDIKDELTGKIIRGSKIGDLLNELYYENHRIKRRNNRYVKQNRELIEENEQLKKYIRGLELRKVECQSWASDVRELREQNCQLEKENEQLKQSVSNLKDTIVKITIAYQRKYDRTIVKLVNEVYDEDISDLIKELYK